jgi:ABC-type transport system involved in Fe-S cluster assembly fused permease/ATPase subunit
VVLEDVDFTVEPGQTVGLVGPTGAGKTTVLKLLLRMYDVDEGAVRLDGHDVRDLSFATLRGAMGYVGQEKFRSTGRSGRTSATAASRRATRRSGRPPGRPRPTSSSRRCRRNTIPG